MRKRSLPEARDEFAGAGAVLSRPRGDLERAAPSDAATAQESDELLVERCRQGSEAAFEALVRRHERALQRHCATMVGQSAASDATQEAFLSAWSAIRAGAEVRLLRPWLFTIAHRKALGLLRERRRAPVELLEESLSNGVSSAEQAQRTAHARETLAVLAALPEPQRAALLGVAVHGRSGRQVARQLGVSELTARQLVFRARAALRAGAAVCLGPPLLILRWIRRLLETGRRLGGAARAGGGWVQGMTAAKVAAFGVLGVAAVGASALHFGARAPRARAPRVERRAGSARSTALERPAAAVSGAATSSKDRAADTPQRALTSAVALHRSRRSPAALNPRAEGESSGTQGGSRGAGPESAADTLVAADASASGAPADAATKDPASGLLAASATTTSGAEGVASQVVTLAGTGTGDVRHTVATSVGAVRRGVQRTVAAATATAQSAAGALGVSVALPGGQTQPAGAGAVTSPAASVAPSVGQAAGGSVGAVTNAASTALAPSTGAASSTVSQTVAAVTSTAAADTSKVVVGATGAVSTLVQHLTGG
jgi:RNA polymerase sigma factor (sigma-70 family)